MDTQTFEVTLERPDDSETAVFIRVPLDVRALFGQARAPVRVTVGDHTFRTTVAVYGGEYLLPLNRANREAAGVDAGDTVTVTLAFDDEPRVVELPGDLATALESVGALEHWRRLSFTHQREYVEWIEGAARPETRARRVAQAVDRVGAGLRRR
ncbi:MAG TPA: YdeI/OmpD-associated family protein [Actinopolymorphaceae bacterium]|nr:YdeI/OmpD-associated family protein [Actinopolymorphaceae bacterium]